LGFRDRQYRRRAGVPRSALPAALRGHALAGAGAAPAGGTEGSSRPAPGFIGLDPHRGQAPRRGTDQLPRHSLCRADACPLTRVLPPVRSRPVTRSRFWSCLRALSRTRLGESNTFVGSISATRSATSASL